MMRMNEYQIQAQRTIGKNMSVEDMTLHALHGMASEVGEIHGIYQKMYQGHSVDEEDFKKELGDLLWFIAEYCTARGWTMEDVAERNIDKLRKRYPDGFSAERSINREE